MTQKITYYAIVDEYSNSDRPAGVLRRVEDEKGEVDEVFSRKLKWEFSPLLYAAERGDLTNEFLPISEEEAGRIVEGIRRSVRGEE